jgi:hypothetical protein
VQALLRAWSAARPLASVANPATMLDHASLPWFVALNKSLLGRLDDAGFRARIRHSTRLMRTLAAEIDARADAHGGAARSELQRVLSEGAGFDASDDRSAAMLFDAAPQTQRKPARRIRR